MEEKYKFLGNFREHFENIDENSIKIDFVTIFGTDLAKIRAFGNIIIFRQQYFPFRGAGHSWRSPRLRH